MLQQLKELRPHLARCVTLEEWVTFCSKQRLDKQDNVIDPCKQLIIGEEFWDTITTIITLLEGLICLLRTVDGNLPCIGNFIPSLLTILTDIDNL